MTEKKQTSVAAAVAKQEAEALAAEAVEDAKLSERRAPKGKVWVRLIRPHYDAEGTYHAAGPALLNADAIPSSARKITPADLDAEDEDA